MAHKGHAFSVQIYRCSVQNRLVHTNIRSFSVQKLSFSVENSMLLRTNRMLLRAKFDISPYKSQASAWRIRCCSVQIERFPVQNSMLRGKLHSELGVLGSNSPRPTNRRNYVSGEGSCVVCKDILSPTSKWSRPAFNAANIFKKMLNFAQTVGRSFSTVSALKIFLK